MPCHATLGLEGMFEHFGRIRQLQAQVVAVRQDMRTLEKDSISYELSGLTEKLLKPQLGPLSAHP